MKATSISTEQNTAKRFSRHCKSEERKLFIAAAAAMQMFMDADWDMQVRYMRQIGRAK